MDSDTLRSLRNLSGSAKETLIQICLVYPDTESVRSDIERAATLKTIIKYENLSADFDRIVTEMNGNPRYVQLQTKDISIELLKSMTSLGDVSLMLHYISTDEDSSPLFREQKRFCKSWSYSFHRIM